MTRLLPTYLRFLLTISLLSSCLACRVTTPSGTLGADYYRVTRSAKPDLLGQQVYILDSGDSLHLLLPATGERRYVDKAEFPQLGFRLTEIDVDVFTLPFKIRRSQGTLPGQLDANFNAAVYVGRRVDLYSFRTKVITPTYGVRQLRSRGFGYGAFAGIGAVTLNDFVVNSPINVEYEGVVLNAGVATIYDARIFNIGLAVGFDNLMDPNKTRWIYQQKPWFGVLFGLNLN